MTFAFPIRLKWSLSASVVFLCLFPLLVSAQSGWTQKKGALYAKLSVGGFASDQYYNLNGDRLQTTVFRQAALNLYGEYGLTERLTLITNWPAAKIQSFQSTETVGGIGDLMLGAKWGVLRGNFPVSLSVLPEIPTGPANLFAQNKTISFEQINLPTGDGEFNVHTILAVSHSFYPLPLYANLYSGLNFRTGFNGQSFQNQWRSGLELGGNFLGKFWGRGILSVQQGLGESAQLTDFIRGEGTTYTALSLGLTYKLNAYWGIDASYQTLTDWLVPRRNLYSGQMFMLGVVFERE